MKLQIRTQGFELTDAIETHVNRQLERHLASVDEHIMAVEVFMRDINGPKGGDDMSVLVNLRLSARLSVTVEETAGDLYNAISRAARAVKHTAKRTLRKQQIRHKARLREMRQYPDLASAVP